MNQKTFFDILKNQKTNYSRMGKLKPPRFLHIRFCGTFIGFNTTVI